MHLFSQKWFVTQGVSTTMLMLPWLPAAGCSTRVWGWAAWSWAPLVAAILWWLLDTQPASALHRVLRVPSSPRLLSLFPESALLVSSSLPSLFLVSLFLVSLSLVSTSLVILLLMSLTALPLPFQFPVSLSPWVLIGKQLQAPLPGVPPGPCRRVAAWGSASKSYTWMGAELCKGTGPPQKPPSQGSAVHAGLPRPPSPAGGVQEGERGGHSGGGPTGNTGLQHWRGGVNGAVEERKVCSCGAASRGLGEAGLGPAGLHELILGDREGCTPGHVPARSRHTACLRPPCRDAAGFFPSAGFEGCSAAGYLSTGVRMRCPRPAASWLPWKGEAGEVPPGWAVASGAGGKGSWARRPKESLAFPGLAGCPRAGGGCWAAPLSPCCVLCQRCAVPAVHLLQEG